MRLVSKLLGLVALSKDQYVTGKLKTDYWRTTMNQPPFRITHHRGGNRLNGFSTQARGYRYAKRPPTDVAAQHVISPEEYYLLQRLDAESQKELDNLTPG